MLFNRQFQIAYRDLWFFFLVALGAIVALSEGAYELNFAFSLLVGLAIHRVANNKSSVHIMTLIGYAVFIFAPALVNGFFYETPFELFYATSFLIYILLRDTGDCEDREFLDKKPIYLTLFFAYSIFIAISSVFEFGVNYLYFLSPYVMFFILSLRPNKNILNSLVVLLFFIVFSLYFIFGWSGYGRTVTFGNMIVAIIYIAKVYKIQINKYLFSFAAVFAAVSLTARKGFDLDGARSLDFLNDSAFGPYRLAVTFIDRYSAYGIDFSGFFDQIVFTVLSFVPREVWGSKPFGFGFVYVVENFDQYLVDAGHSIASTLFGDHIYYLGWWGFVSGIILIFIVGRVVRFIYSRRVFDGALYILISCNMMVLVWGGMTSFSARLIFPFIGILPYYFLFFLYKSLVLSRGAATPLR